MAEIPTNLWIRKAENDLAAAEALGRLGHSATDVICFHCHQACEKFFKAVLIAAGIRFPRTHDLLSLLVWIEEQYPGARQWAGEIGELNRYAVEVRYPDEFYLPTVAETETALQIARRVRAFCREKLEDMSDTSDKNTGKPDQTI